MLFIYLGHLQFSSVTECQQNHLTLGILRWADSNINLLDSSDNTNNLIHISVVVATITDNIAELLVSGMLQ